MALLRGVRNLAPAVCAAGPGWRHARLPKPVRYVTTLPAAVRRIKELLRGRHHEGDLGSLREQEPSSLPPD